MGPTPFDTVMYFLPMWLPALLVGLGLQWLVARSAALSALRRHERDLQAQRATATAGHGPAFGSSA